MEAVLRKRYSYPVDQWAKKVVATPWFWVVMCGFLFTYPLVRSVYRELPPPLPKLGKVGNFEFTNQHGDPFGTNNLNGKAYIANFMFTSCPTTCANLMAKMQIVQKRIRGVGNKMNLVTFTVDPENDTVPVLLKYSRKLKANPHIWHFLTHEKKAMRELLVNGYKVPMGDLEELTGVYTPNNVTLFDIAHTEKLVLVDKEGVIRGYYGLDDNSINQLMIDVGLLINRPSAVEKNS